MGARVSPMQRSMQSDPASALVVAAPALRCTPAVEAGPARGLRRALRSLVAELGVLARHRLTLVGTRISAPDAEQMRRVNLGCGAKRKPGWLNVDLHRAADLRLDLRERLPLPDGCADRIYTEHFLEHLEYPGDARRFLAECRRILRPGGTISVGVPDSEWPLREYVSGGEYYRVARQLWHPSVCRTRLDHINWHFRENGAHLWAYDAESLAATLEETGFVDVERRAFDPALDSPDRQPGTLYMDARRPGAPAR